jgi:hypothetical protein
MLTSYPTVTLWQPWASLIAAGAKPFEFRSWPAPQSLWDRRVAVHAGARKVSVTEVRALLVKLHSPRWRETGLIREPAIALLERVRQEPGILPLASVVCLATLGEPIRNARLAAALGLDRANDSDRHEHSNWGWPLRDVERLEPIVPARGAQGWWTWRREAA